MIDASLEALVKELPEVYQPIYGAPEIGASRGDEDRVAVLIDHITRLSKSVGRTLRILDLGSAQGYLSFRMAELGHEVTGVESLGINVAVARAIQDRHPALAVSFVEGDLSDALQTIDLGSYDVVVAFSVLHHVAHRDGHDVAARLVADLCASIPHGLFEMALPSEPLFWAEALPADPRVTLAPYPFIREIGQTRTHLSDVGRPMFFCSNTFALVNGELVPILSYTSRPHADANPLLGGMHRYYTLPIGIAKIAARFEDGPDEGLLDNLKAELRQEAEVLGTLGRAKVDVPELLEFADGSSEAILVRTTYPGVLLSEAVTSLQDGERAGVTTQVLGALADLEERGLYHRDLRLWNIIYDGATSQAHLIDYGAIASSPDDTMWPFDAHFALLTFLTALWGEVPDQTGLEAPRSSLLDAVELAGPAVALVSALVVHPRDSQVFRDLSALWAQVGSSETGTVWPGRPLAWRWLADIERQREDIRSDSQAHLAELGRTRLELDKQVRQLVVDQKALADQETRYQQELADRDIRHQRELADRDSQLVERSAERDRLASELENVYRSVSWRVTEPLRRLRARQRRFLGRS
jgi:SAM-dependent methyltransferase